MALAYLISPVVFSAGESIDEAIINAQEAIAGHLEILAEDGLIAPTPSAIDRHSALPEYQGAIWAFAEVDVTPFLGGAEKATITLPRLLIKKNRCRCGWREGKKPFGLPGRFRRQNLGPLISYRLQFLG